MEQVAREWTLNYHYVALCMYQQMDVELWVVESGSATGRALFSFVFTTDRTVWIPARKRTLQRRPVIFSFVLKGLFHEIEILFCFEVAIFVPWKRLWEHACGPEISYRKPPRTSPFTQIFSCIQWGADTRQNPPMTEREACSEIVMRILKQSFHRKILWKTLTQ